MKKKISMLTNYINERISWKRLGREGSRGERDKGPSLKGGKGEEERGRAKEEEMEGRGIYDIERGTKTLH